MNNKWIYRIGYISQEYSSFPYAFRSMFQSVKKELEKGKTMDEINKSVKIISPLKDIHGDVKIYSYSAALELARNQGLLSVDGEINSKEFKKK